MAVIRPEKQAAIATLKEKLSTAKGAVLVDYRGLTVAQDTKLRRKLREAGVEYRVVKNTLTNLAAKEAGIEGLEVYLEGTTALAVSATDPVAPAKILSEFQKEIAKTVKTFQIKAGVLEGKVIDANGVKALADLPSRVVLLAKVAGTMQAPISGLVSVMAGTIRKFVYAVDAVRQQKESA